MYKYRDIHLTIHSNADAYFQQKQRKMHVFACKYTLHICGVNNHSKCFGSSIAFLTSKDPSRFYNSI